MQKRTTDWNKARRALQALLRNPDDTAKVFEILEALRGGAPERTLRRFRRTPTGRELLRRRDSLRRVLGDREYLSGLPAGSLGRAYLAFMDREGISADGLAEASRAGHGRRSEPAGWKGSSTVTIFGTSSPVTRATSSARCRCSRSASRRRGAKASA
jgi:hypothetical protein